MTEDSSKLDKALQIIGKRLEEVRKEKGYSNYEKFVFTHDLTRSKYSGYENGSNMNLTTFFKLLYALDIDAVSFFSTINDELSQLDQEEE